MDYSPFVFSESQGYVLRFSVQKRMFPSRETYVSAMENVCFP